MKDVWHEVLRDKHESFKWSLLIDTAIETVRRIMGNKRQIKQYKTNCECICFT